MLISEATLKALKGFGLTEYEVQAYVALVDGGIQSASEISSSSKVPYSRIYDVLGRLEERGFIQVRRGRPTKYVAKAPTEVVKIIRLNMEEQIEKYSKVIIDELQPRFERETQASPRDVWLIHGRAGILAKALEMLDTAREEVILSIPSLNMTELAEEFEIGSLAELLDRLLALKVPHVHILTSRVPPTLRKMIPRNFEVRTRDRVFGAGLVVDRQNTLIMLVGTETGSELLGIFSSHSVFAEMASSYFWSLFNESTPI